MKQFDVMVPVTAVGHQIWRVKAESPEAALKAVRTRDELFAVAEFIGEEVEVERCHVENVELGDIEEVA